MRFSGRFARLSADVSRRKSIVSELEDLLKDHGPFEKSEVDNNGSVYCSSYEIDYSTLLNAVLQGEIPREVT